MKIIETKPTLRKTYRQLAFGDVFHEAEYGVCMKTSAGCISLKTGLMEKILPDTLVRLMRAEIHVELL